MKRIIFLMAIALLNPALPSIAQESDARPPRDREGGPPPERRREENRRPQQDGPDRPGPRPGFVPPFVLALDPNNDGVIDEKELENAASALKRLDRNGDGKITRDEAAPGRPGGMGPGEDRPRGAGRDEGGRPGRPGGPSEPPRPPGDDRPGERPGGGPGFGPDSRPGGPRFDGPRGGGPREEGPGPRSDRGERGPRPPQFRDDGPGGQGQGGPGAEGPRRRGERREGGPRPPEFRDGPDGPGPERRIEREERIIRPPQFRQGPPSEFREEVRRFRGPGQGPGPRGQQFGQGPGREFGEEVRRFEGPAFGPGPGPRQFRPEGRPHGFGHGGRGFGGPPPMLHDGPGPRGFGRGHQGPPMMRERFERREEVRRFGPGRPPGFQRGPGPDRFGGPGRGEPRPHFQNMLWSVPMELLSEATI